LIARWIFSSLSRRQTCADAGRDRADHRALQSTILRLLGSLERYGFVWQRADGTYQLGPACCLLPQCFRIPSTCAILSAGAGPTSVIDTSESATFYIRDGDDQVVCSALMAAMSCAITVRPGSRRALNKSAASATLLQFDGGLRAPLSRDAMVLVSVGNVNLDMAAIGAGVWRRWRLAGRNYPVRPQPALYRGICRPPGARGGGGRDRPLAAVGRKTGSAPPLQPVALTAE
jgi:hypothetical protein